MDDGLRKLAQKSRPELGRGIGGPVLLHAGSAGATIASRESPQPTLVVLCRPDRTRTLRRGQRPVRPCQGQISLGKAYLRTTTTTIRRPGEPPPGPAAAGSGASAAGAVGSAWEGSGEGTVGSGCESGITAGCEAPAVAVATAVAGAVAEAVAVDGWTVPTAYEFCAPPGSSWLSSVGSFRPDSFSSGFVSGDSRIGGGPSFSSPAFGASLCERRAPMRRGVCAPGRPAIGWGWSGLSIKYHWLAAIIPSTQLPPAIHRPACQVQRLGADEQSPSPGSGADHRGSGTPR